MYSALFKGLWKALIGLFIIILIIKHYLFRKQCKQLSVDFVSISFFVDQRLSE